MDYVQILINTCSQEETENVQCHSAECSKEYHDCVIVVPYTSKSEMCVLCVILGNRSF